MNIKKNDYNIKYILGVKFIVKGIMESIKIIIKNILVVIKIHLILLGDIMVHEKQQDGVLLLLLTKHCGNLQMNAKHII